MNKEPGAEPSPNPLPPDDVESSWINANAPLLRMFAVLAVVSAVFVAGGLLLGKIVPRLGIDRSAHVRSWGHHGGSRGSAAPHSARLQKEDRKRQVEEVIQAAQQFSSSADEENDRDE